MQTRIVQWLLWLLLPLLAGAVVLWYFGTPEPQAPPPYSSAAVERGELVATVSATGSLSPLVTVLVGSQVSGTIQSLHADFNSEVSKGDIIAQIDPALFEANVAEAEASLKSAEAQRDKAWVAVLDARRNVRRLTGLQAKQLVSESELDAARFALDAATVEHRVQEATVAEQAAALDHERQNLAYTTIRAPIDGVVISRDVDVGQTVAASLQAPTLFTIAGDLTRMQIETDVDEAFIGSVSAGQPVSFTVFAFPQRTFRGQLAQVRLLPRVEAGVVKYNCIISVDNPDMALKPGMTATVAIEVDRRADVLKVANAALRFVPAIDAGALQELRDQLESDEAVIWTPAGTELQPHKVRIGLVGEKETEILGAGLTAGMPVALPERKDTLRRRRSLQLF